MEKLKKTPLYDQHVALGAKMVPFAGYEMPVQYAGVSHEHHVVRQKVGMFDVSHMGEFWVEGADATAFLNSVTSNDVAKLTPGKVQYSCLPNATGGIVDDLLVYCVNDTKYMLVVNASNMAKDWAWLQQFAGNFDVLMTDVSEGTALLAVQGPLAAQALQSLTDLDLGAMTYYTFGIGSFAGVSNVVVSATGYTGAGGFEIYIPNAHAAAAWDAIIAAGAPLGLEPIGLGARDTLRLEMGFCLYGNDIDDTTSPIEAGLGWITKFTKEFTNSAALKAQKEAGVARKLVGIKLLERGVPRHGYPIVDASGAAVGEVTSGTMAPSLNEAIGMAYVPTASAAPGSTVFVEIRGKALKAEVVSLPFYKA
ncbi:MAG: glycine cleavage system protein T [Cryomorphaceae bacterium BACL18 MAG-120507-bin74]|jgi:aminomethyltransferase|nr:MAG: glycine cleavage system protein T [Cryomorphaceae bacterium BACL18 MAG-120507-bin74]HAG34789.1 glycine cleavage system aminomethyltransferase GcvT [Cryomorphaceae bacterium]